MSDNCKDSFQISFAPLQLTEIYSLVDMASNGAIVLMSGMVRNQTGGRAVTHLEYQAYQPMALEVFRQIARDIRQKSAV
jgi:molybdopterin synthase catalytic subunit